jgi:hypothetical protein
MKQIISLTKKLSILVYMLFAASLICEGQRLQPRSSSALKNGNWYKIAIRETGVYKLDFNFLTQKLGIAPADLKAGTIGVFGYGGGALPEQNNFNFRDDIPENTIDIVDINSNGTIEEGDYILFYAEGPYRRRYNPIRDLFEHSSAYYSDYQHFFVTTTNGTGRKPQTQSISGSPNKIYTTYDYFDVRDEDSINPNSSGRIWFSSRISNFDKRISVPLPIKSCNPGDEATITFAYHNKIAGANLNVGVNNIVAKTIALTESRYLIVDSFKIPCPGPNARFTMDVNSPITENLYLDYITVNTKAELRYTGNQFSFRFKDAGVADFRQAQFAGNTNFRVWNVSDIQNIRNVQLNSTGATTGFLFNNQDMPEFIVFENGNAIEPIAVGKIENQNLHESSAFDNVIIVNKQWQSIGNQLAEFHKSESGIESLVVDVDKIYNEYSSGNKDVTAIRRFIIQQKGKSTATINLKSVLLFGKACVDYKKILGNNCTDYIPTYETRIPADFIESFCTDDFYGLLEPSESNLDATQKTLDIGIGRIPVSNLQEAKDAFAKIKKYKAKESYNDWRNLSTFVSDDYDDAVDADFYRQNEKTLSLFVKDNNIKTNVSKIYLDAFRQEQFSGGQRYPDAEKLLKDNISYGSLLITYIGHGGSANWAQERLLSVQDLPIYQNLNSLPFMTTATCGFAPYDKPSADKSAGEMFLLRKDGGAIALLTTCREVYISDQGPFMKNFIQNFYNRTGTGSFRTFGEIARMTKNDNATDLNSQKVVLLGDPALVVNMPEFNVVTTTITNGTDDTMKSLSKMRISGEVRDLANQSMTNFNGYCQVTIYDKRTENRLNYNDIKDPKLPEDTFEIQDSRIFRGSATVTNGKFSIEFIVPKDINYAMGRGRISYYAADINQKPYRDAAGMDTNVWIGGANLNASEDQKPPIVRLYMNDDKFVFGGITNADPILLAKLSDESGINTTGAGIGHDITAILDENIRLPIVLNNYYRSVQGDFTNGTVNYPFFQLKDGKHTIRVKAWDVYNNPGEGVTEFIVARNEGIALRHVLNYPNPFTTNTKFQFEHNRPNETLDVTIQVLTLTGKVVKKMYKQINTTGFRVDNQFVWDGRDDIGEPIGRGAYIYVVKIQDSRGESAQQYEKLVLLQ